MTDDFVESVDPTRTIASPEPTESFPVQHAPSASSVAPASSPSSAPGSPSAWMAAPPPPPPGQDPGVPVTEAPPGSFPTSGPARPSWSASAERLQRESPWVLAAASILAALGLAWLAALLTGLRHQPGLTAQSRVLDILAPGSIEWAAILLVGLGLLAGSRLSPGRGPGHLAPLVARGFVLATGAVLFAAGLGILVELANFGNGIDAAFSGILVRLGAAVVSGAALWWAWQSRHQTAR